MRRREGRETRSAILKREEEEEEGGQRTKADVGHPTGRERERESGH